MSGEYINGQPSDYEEWLQQREDARNAAGGALVESSTDDPKDIIDANLFQPKARGELIVTVSHSCRPDSPGGETSGENDLTEERYERLYDGAELRADHARFKKRLAEARKSNPEFDREVQAGDDALISEATRRAILKSPNSEAVYHFLAVNPQLVKELARVEPHAAAIAVRVISKDLQNGRALPPDSDYAAWAAHRNAQRSRGRDGNG